MSYIHTPQQPSTVNLSIREIQIVKLRAEGRTLKQIAAALEIQVSTVDTHLCRIGQKLDSRNAAVLTRYALQHGLTTLEEA